MKELADASDEGRMMEIFGTGTAAIVSPVRRVSWKGRIVDCGLADDVEAGPIALQMKDCKYRGNYCGTGQTSNDTVDCRDGSYSIWR